MKTRKTEINNEIVSLRQFVRQARIRVVNKLTREAKKLRATHGDEKQVKRNKSKAEKLLREVFALKRIKDDEISKFGAVRFDELQTILRDPLSDDGTRAMVKIVRYKSLSPRIAALREKFPDYGELISLDKKGAVNKKRNGTAESTKKSSKPVLKPAKTDVGGTVETENVNYVESVASINDDDAQEPRPTKKKEKVNGTGERETKQNARNLEKRLKVPETGKESTNSNSRIIPKVVSKEATVKRFTEILEEAEEVGDGREILQERNERRTTEEGERDELMNQLSNEAAEASTETDDFFLNSNKVIPRSDPEEKRTGSTDDINYDKPYPTTKRRKFHDGKGSYNERSKSAHRDRNNAQEANGTRKRNRKTTINEQWKSGTKSIEEKNENLHPSWAAKKKQQDILKQGFQGKKIKFDD